MRMVRFLAALALAAAPAMLRADDSSPAAQMKASLAALSQGDAKALINSLPKSYRADAQELVREAVGKIDAEVWNKGFAAAKKAIKLLKDKKALVLEATSAFVQLPPDEAGKIYDGVVGLLAPVVESDIADHSAAAKMDLDSWAADVGNKQLKALMGVETKLPPPVNMTIKEMFKVMADAKIEVIKVEGDTAEIKMDLPAGLKQPGAAETQKLKKVDGVWVAAEMADKYAETMKKARAGLAKIDFAAHKDKALKSIVAFEDALKIVDGAKDAGGLMQALQEAGEKLKEAAGPGGR